MPPHWKTFCGEPMPVMNVNAPVPVDSGRTPEKPARSQINVVLFSGGSGTQSITEAFLKHPQISLTILINAYDDGHSTGRLRRFIPGMLGPSDVRKNIARLMPKSDQRHLALRFLSDHRLPAGMDYAKGMDLARRIADQEWPTF